MANGVVANSYNWWENPMTLIFNTPFLHGPNKICGNSLKMSHGFVGIRGGFQSRMIPIDSELGPRARRCEKLSGPRRCPVFWAVFGQKSSVCEVENQLMDFWASKYIEVIGKSSKFFMASIYEISKNCYRTATKYQRIVAENSSIATVASCVSVAQFPHRSDRSVVCWHPECKMTSGPENGEQKPPKWWFQSKH